MGSMSRERNPSAQRRVRLYLITAAAGSDVTAGQPKVWDRTSANCSVVSAVA